MVTEGQLKSIREGSASIDPAINSTKRIAETISLHHLNVDEGCVYVFDFDGVIASRLDDDVYKLAPTDDELKLLSRAAECFGIRCHGMEQRYQRHLLYQAAAWYLRLPIEPGPAFSQARDSGQRAQLFILTARSGWHAVERLRKYLSASDIRPIEIYNVGRVKKDRQIELLCREFNSKQIYYIEDSFAHLADAAAIAVNNLRLVSIEGSLQPEGDDVNLRQHFSETIEAAISSFPRLERESEYQRKYSDVTEQPGPKIDS